MGIIKLDAIESTNDFLKDLAADQPVADYTVVTAERQTKGRGQMGAKWESQAGKNLIMSILIHNPVENIQKIFLLNAAIAFAVAQVLSDLEASDITIKWPNDIMSGSKKIGGILIENSIGGNGIRSVVGLGLNVNQTEFETLPRASSLAVETGREWNRDILLEEIVKNIKAATANLEKRENEILANFNARLFRYGLATGFRSAQGTFMGEIVNVGVDGLLNLRHSNGELLSYDLKQVEMLY